MYEHPVRYCEGSICTAESHASKEYVAMPSAMDYWLYKVIKD